MAKISIPVVLERDARHLCIDIPIRYDDDFEEIRQGAFAKFLNSTDWSERPYPRLRLRLNLDTKRVACWPQGETGRLHTKVCDEGSYELRDRNDRVLGRIDEDYVPTVMPGVHCGDYVILSVQPDGTVSGWDSADYLGDLPADSEWEWSP